MVFKPTPPILKIIKAFAIDASDITIYSKFYDKNLQNNTNHIKDIVEKIRQYQSPLETTESFIVKNTLVVFIRLDGGFVAYIMGDSSENELLFSRLLTAIADVIMHFIPPPYDKEQLLKRYDMLLVIIDEFIDSGTILTLDSITVSNNCRSYFSDRNLNNSFILKAFQYTKEFV